MVGWLETIPKLVHQNLIYRPNLVEAQIWLFLLLDGLPVQAKMLLSAITFDKDGDSSFVQKLWDDVFFEHRS